MDELIKKKLQTIIFKSEKSLRIAEGLANQGDYDVACSRAYYSTFYQIHVHIYAKEIIIEFSEFLKNLGYDLSFSDYRGRKIDYEAFKLSDKNISIEGITIRWN